eukprot:1382069-Amorphochlora_amoeboformis.AAC.1
MIKGWAHVRHVSGSNANVAVRIGILKDFINMEDFNLSDRLRISYKLLDLNLADEVTSSESDSGVFGLLHL